MSLPIGMDLDRGYYSGDFVTDQKSMEIVLDSPLLLLREVTIPRFNDLLPLLENLKARRKPLVIMARDFGSGVIDSIVELNNHGTIQVLSTSAPVESDAGPNLVDLAVVTGGKVTSGDLTHVNADDLGGARRVIVGPDRTKVVGGNGDVGAIERRVRALRDELDTASAARTEQLLNRIANLLTGSGNAASTRDYYTILAALRTDTREQIATRYREFLRRGDPLDREHAEAYRVLCDPDLRARYDRYGLTLEGAPPQMEALIGAIFGGTSTSSAREPVAEPAAPGIPIRKEEMERLAGVLHQAASAGLTTDEQFRRLHRQFIGSDDSGVKWSFGLKSRQWNRGDGQQWSPATPPPTLNIASEVLEELNALAERVR